MPRQEREKPGQPAGIRPASHPARSWLVGGVPGPRSLHLQQQEPSPVPSAPPKAQGRCGLLTYTVQEQLALGREAVVDDVVQQRDVQAPGCQVRHDEGGALAERELGEVDLAGRLVQGTVDVGAAHPLGRQQLLGAKTRGGRRVRRLAGEEGGRAVAGMPRGAVSLTLTPSLTSCKTLGKLPNLSAPSLSSLQNGENNSSFYVALL